MKPLVKLESTTKYEMVLVPAEDFPIREYIEQFPDSSMADSALEPFYVGRHEVTNRHFLEFLRSEIGDDWRIEKATKAGSGRDIPPSQYREYTNEYHLYEWSDITKSALTSEREFAPDVKILDHPVVWVSWFAAVAFCNWLSLLEGRRQEYTNFELHAPTGSELPGYRLPSCKEWFYAAQGLYGDITRPWEHIPFPLPSKSLEMIRKGMAVDSSILDKIEEYRKIVEKEILRPNKSTMPVLEDHFGPYGTSGMLGNVKEWTTESLDGPGGVERVVMGATSFIGDSFEFRYWNSLFPKNTNPDLGFRIVRSLSSDEAQIVSNA